CTSPAALRSTAGRAIRACSCGSSTSRRSIWWGGWAEPSGASERGMTDRWEREFACVSTGPGTLSTTRGTWTKLARAGADPAKAASGGVETNVSRIYRSIKETSAQTKWYDRGVGTDWYNRAAGGAFGLGLSRKIREGYKFLSDTYDD